MREGADCFFFSPEFFGIDYFLLVVLSTGPRFFGSESERAEAGSRGRGLRDREALTGFVWPWHGW